MIYTNLKENEVKLHGLFESSNLKSTDVGNIYDVLVQNEGGTNIDVDNGVAVHVGDYTGNGLQERKGTIATNKQKIAVVGAPANVKDAFTNAQAQPYNFYIPAGKPAKAYEIVEEDIFGVASYQFTKESAEYLKKDAYVVVDGNGMWVAQQDEPVGNGFVGKIHSISTGTYFTIVRIFTIQNKDVE